MGTIAIQIPTVGNPNSTEDPKIASGLTTIQTVINGNLDSSNLAASVLTSAGINSGTKVKGASIIATTETRTNTAFGTLTTPDQVTGIQLAANGMLAIWYHATWQESSAGHGQAAIFLNAVQLSTYDESFASPIAQVAVTGGVASPNQDMMLATYNGGLCSVQSASAALPYTGDVALGQVLAVTNDNGGFNQRTGGPCYAFATAGSYTVSVQYAASSGSVTAKNRRLYVQALSFD